MVNGDALKLNKVTPDVQTCTLDTIHLFKASASAVAENLLTHWDLYKMVDNLQAIFSNVIYWTKISPRNNDDPVF